MISILNWHYLFCSSTEFSYKGFTSAVLKSIIAGKARSVPLEKQRVNIELLNDVTETI